MNVLLTSELNVNSKLIKRQLNVNFNSIVNQLF